MTLFSSFIAYHKDEESSQAYEYQEKSNKYNPKSYSIRLKAK